MNESRKAGGNDSSAVKYSPMSGISGITKRNNGIARNPTTMEAMAPDAVYPRQKSDIITIGQNVAAIPDQPKITNQKIVRLGDTNDTLIAIPKAKTANTTVKILESFADSTPPNS